MGEQGPTLIFGVRTNVERHRGGLRARCWRPLAPAVEECSLDPGRDELRPQGLPSSIVNLGDDVEFRNLPWRPCLGMRPRVGGDAEGVDAHPMTGDVIRMPIETALGLRTGSALQNASG